MDNGSGERGGWRRWAVAAMALMLAAGCAGRQQPPALLELRSEQVGFVTIRMGVREIERGANASLLAFKDLAPDVGTKLNKGIFRLRAAASLAEHRGYRYFVLLESNPGESQYLVGLLPRADADFGALFGEGYAGMSREGVLDTGKIQPLVPR